MTLEIKILQVAVDRFRSFSSYMVKKHTYIHTHSRTYTYLVAKHVITLLLAGSHVMVYWASIVYAVQ